MPTAYISLGSNLDDRQNLLRKALQRLAERGGKITATSSIYETSPVGITEQPKFLNAAVRVETDLGAEELMRELLAIERDLGRDRSAAPAKGPRRIDLDLLLYGDKVIESRLLKVPHPAMHERSFVLVPLAEIAPTAIHPVLNRSIAELLARLPRGPGDVVRLFSKERYREGADRGR